MADVLRNIIFVNLTVRMIGDTAAGNLDEINTEADKTLLRLKTKLMEFKEYEAVKKVGNDIRTAVKAKCYGGRTMKYKAKDGKVYQVGAGIAGIVKSGCYMAPVAMVDQIKTIMEDGERSLRDSVAQLCEVYEIRRDEMLVKLQGQATLKDYPSLDKIRRSIGITYNFLTLNAPDDMPEEAKKWKEQIGSAIEETRVMQRLMMKELTDSMLAKLTPGEDGRKKRFHESAIASFSAFLNDFESKDLTNDSELAGLVEKARAILAGKDVEAYRKDEGFREMVNEKLSEVKESLDSLVESVPERSILILD